MAILITAFTIALHFRCWVGERTWERGWERSVSAPTKKWLAVFYYFENGGSYRVEKVRRKNLLFMCSIWTYLDHVIFMLWTVLKRWDQRLFFPYFWLCFVCYEAPKYTRFRQKAKTKKEKKRKKEGEEEKWGRDAPNHRSCDLHRPLYTQKADCATAAHDTI